MLYARHEPFEYVLHGAHLNWSGTKMSFSGYMETLLL